MKKVKIAVIPAAGMGTRMLPATISIPKEMLPVVDKPVIQYVVEECITSGIKEIIIVKTADKNSIVKHFTKNQKLENHLKKSGKLSLLKDIQKIYKSVKIRFIDQVGPYGNGTPTMCAQKYIGNNPHVTIWGDEFIYANPPRLKQMIDTYNKYGHSVISGIKIPDKKDLSKYGIAKTKHIDKNIYQILSIVEKPTPKQAPSNLATHGAYLFTPKIFDYLNTTKIGKGGELWLVDAINKLMKVEPIYTCQTKNANYYDTGNKFNYLRTCIEFGLKDPEIKQTLNTYLKKRLKM
jgi:UTP--glucose-1-phosphate uridylyltransferase